METNIQGYRFDGDPDGLKYVQKLTLDEMQTLIYAVNYRGKASILALANYNPLHIEITKTEEEVYMISRLG